MLARLFVSFFANDGRMEHFRSSFFAHNLPHIRIPSRISCSILLPETRYFRFGQIHGKQEMR
jgi:hypothetical protein